MSPSPSVPVAVARVVVAVLPAVVVWSELLHWRASRRPPAARASSPRDVGREAIVVLGFRNRGERANYVNRYRVRAALRSQSRMADETVLVLCGGRVGGDIPEAVLMMRYARHERHYSGVIALEEESRTTLENVRNAAALIEDADVIKIVSNSLHAELGRRYLEQIRPDLAARLVRARDYRVGEVIIVKVLAAGIALRRSNHRWRVPAGHVP